MKLSNRSSDWGILLALTVLWGSAFLFTKLALETIPSQLVVVGRLAVAALFLVPLAMLFAQRPRGGLRYWLFMVLIALFGSALPFSLISRGVAVYRQWSHRYPHGRHANGYPELVAFSGAW